MTKTQIAYVGDELPIFAAASNWKAYLRRMIAPYLHGDVAEVGAGQGATTKALAGIPGVTGWSAIEPDPDMAELLRCRVAQGDLPVEISVRCGTLSDLPEAPTFDTIIYIDVLEHIENDRGELETAAARLRNGGSIIVLSPAWQFLYSPFDAAIGHYRRYKKSTLRAVRPHGLVEDAAFYVDSIGLLASLANKLFLKQQLPRPNQILMWDRIMIPLSKVVDRLTMRIAGRSVLLIWKKPDT